MQRLCELCRRHVDIGLPLPGRTPQPIADEIDSPSYALADVPSDINKGTMRKVGDGLSAKLEVKGGGDKARIQELIKRVYKSPRKVI